MKGVGFRSSEKTSMKNASLDTNTNNTNALDYFGEGRHSALMAECFGDLQRVFKVSPEVANRVAWKIGSDFGALLADIKIGMDEVKLGKLSKAGKFTTIGEAASKVKQANCTIALYTLRALKYVADAKDFGIAFDTDWKANRNLVAYFNDTEKAIAEKAEKARIEAEKAEKAENNP